MRNLADDSRLSIMNRQEATATLMYLCKIGEPEFATRLADKNPHWGLKVFNGRVMVQRKARRCKNNS